MTASERPLEPSAGWRDGAAYVFPLRVYYEDTDLSGVVYHAAYLRFLERGRSEFVRSIGLGHDALLQSPEPLTWAVRRMTIAFDKPARIEEALQARTRVIGIGGARIRLAQEIARGAEVLVTAEVEVCVITLDGRARRIPDAMRKTMLTFLEPTS